MTIYNLSVTMVDDDQRKTTKEYVSADLADEATALASAAALVDSLQDVTELEIISYRLAQRIVYVGALTAGANVDEGATITVRLEDNYDEVMKWPGPIQAIRNGDGTIDVNSTEVQAYTVNFLAAADWTISDGEQISQVLRGKLDK